MAVEREDKHGRIKTDQYRADIACTGRTGPGAAEASEKIADKPAGDRDMVSDRRRDRGVGDAAFMSGIGGNADGKENEVVSRRDLSGGRCIV